MELTRKQEQGLKIAVQRFNDREPYTVISGYAGTGKSTLVKFIIEALQVDPNKVCYAAFTGKAASVLQQKGCQNAITAHHLLYKARPMPNGAYKFIPKAQLEEDYKVIVVDEVSMLPKALWNLLLTHRVYILAIGDPGQLPPVEPDDNNHVLDHPHVFLDEIMRQAEDSEIIRLSMWIREGKPVAQFPQSREQVQIFSSGEELDGMYTWADQIICAMNETRAKINNNMRNILQFPELPVVGDKVISLKNHWDFFSQKGDWCLTNGAIGTIKNFTTQTVNIPPYISPAPIVYMYSDIELEYDNEDIFMGVPIDYKALTTGKKALDGPAAYKLNKNKQLPDAPYEFAYAYAITCHKAQGSEWNKVMVIEEQYPFKVDDHKRWLYTAVTRASEKLVFINK